MRPIENIKLSNIHIPEVSTKGNVCIARDTEDGDIEILENRVEYVPVINEDEKLVIDIHSDRYKLFTNEDFVKVVKKVTGDEFEGYVNIEWNRMDIYYYPDGNLIDVGNAERGDLIRLGIRFSNSYDGSVALRTSLVGIRLACKNGMSFEGLIGSVSNKHTKNSVNAEEFGEIVTQLYSNADLNLLQSIFNEAKMWEIPSGDEIAWVEAFCFVKNIPDALKVRVQEWLIKRHQKGKDNEALSRYDLWCEFTRLITHGYTKRNDRLGDSTTYSETYLQQLHKSVNEILLLEDDKVEKIIKKLREKEVIQERMDELTNVVVVAEP